MAICKLCGKEATLQSSHIIPKFVFKWMKSTGSQYFREGIRPNARAQDGQKVELLCFSCEQLIGASEKWFAEHIFYDFLTDKKEVFVYQEHLPKFMASLF